MQPFLLIKLKIRYKKFYRSAMSSAHIRSGKTILIGDSLMRVLSADSYQTFCEGS